MPIETALRFTGPSAGDADLLAVPFDGDLTADVELPVPVRALLAHHEAKGEAGEVVEIPVAHGDEVRRVLLYGVGDATPRALRKAGATVARRAKGRPAVDVTLPKDAGASGWSAFAEGALLASYTFKIGASRGKAVGEIRLSGPEEARAAVERAEVLAHATALARDLANTPSSEKNPAWLAERAVEVAERSGVSAKIWAPDELAERGFGGILAVGRGSVSPPRMIELSYEPADADGSHVVLVGKGITFDSGGLSLKPNEGMKAMKTDMAGGAVVISVLGALRDLGVRTRVTGLVAAAENMPSGTAQRPGDVITHYGGTTVEVLNTDAEGRLVLADALAYADDVLEPDTVVDIATLTGAIGIALGRELGAVFSSSDDLAEELVSAGATSGDPLWRMPLVQEYRPALDSNVADLSNIDSEGRFGGGAVTAALFLREFTGGRRWAHLDIAGVARSTADDGVQTKGATGFGTRLLLEWLTG
ncbi:leucyl aminopeptidase [Sphaerisporangium sp. TRM90804]|uniref:leucyl aminopeptidase n=1 Tax=Sphaerisporangium sp. TRM90804 TaxID=3031113 RepID=UPI00244722F3|nr:leucyl aminopeptidase [Sphaerisporangium sp. TRM90804]MDH2429864.1 leucyl aminopeptidase [Sphaerisporangium sp. TRM90804]